MEPVAPYMANPTLLPVYGLMRLIASIFVASAKKICSFHQKVASTNKYTVIIIIKDKIMKVLIRRQHDKRLRRQA